MKLYALDLKMRYRIWSKLRKIDKKLPHGVLADKATPIASLIVLGNGREDDIVVPLVCHHLNGSKTVGIIKPESTRYGAIKQLKVYVKEGYKTIAFILDQEDDKLPALGERIKEKLGEIGVKYGEEKWVNGRVVTYDCSLLGNAFKFIVVVNGLDDAGGPSHKIEDHLVRLAGVDWQGDSKDVWNSLSVEYRLSVFRRIYSDKKVAEGVFNQHFEGLGLLDC